jgi:hypothetical protein
MLLQRTCTNHHTAATTPFNSIATSMKQVAHEHPTRHPHSHGMTNPITLMAPGVRDLPRETGALAIGTHKAPVAAVPSNASTWTMLTVLIGIAFTGPQVTLTPRGGLW